MCDYKALIFHRKILKQQVNQMETRNVQTDLSGEEKGKIGIVLQNLQGDGKFIFNDSSHVYKLCDCQVSFLLIDSSFNPWARWILNNVNCSVIIRIEFPFLLAVLRRICENS